MRSSCTESTRLRSLMRVCASRSCCTSCTVYRQNARMTMTVTASVASRRTEGFAARGTRGVGSGEGEEVSADMSRRWPVSTQTPLDYPSDREGDVFFPVPRHDLDADRQT